MRCSGLYFLRCHGTYPAFNSKGSRQRLKYPTRQHEDRQRRGKPKLRLGFIAFAPLFAVLALACWALASPIGSSPDDDFHLASIWCAGGTVNDQCEAASEPGQRAIPEALLGATCFAFKPHQTGSCQNFSADSQMAVTDRGNFAGSYPPVFYSTMNLFVTSGIEVSALVMRFVNILLFVVIGSVLYLVLAPNRRVSLVWGFACTIVPLGAFLIASNNPSAWAIISAGTLWLALLGYFESTGPRKIALGVIAVVSTIMGAGARADAAAYAVLAVFVVGILTAKWNRQWALSAILPLWLIGVAVSFYFSAQQSSSALSGLGPSGGSSPTVNSLSLLITNFLEVPSLWVGVFGSWKLGWLDTTLPGIVWVGGFGMFAALIFAGLKLQTPRKLTAVIVILGAMWVLPTVILQKSQVAVGSEVQPRYLLPLIVMLAGVSLLGLPRSRVQLSTAQVVTVVSVLSVTNSVALLFNIRRYVTGENIAGGSVGDATPWWWSDLPLSPAIIWLVGSVAFALFLGVMSRSELSGKAPASPPKQLIPADAPKPA